MSMFRDYLSLRKVNSSGNAQKEEEETTSYRLIEDECDGGRVRIRTPQPQPQQQQQQQPQQRLSLLDTLTLTLSNLLKYRFIENADDLDANETSMLNKHKFYSDLKHEKRPRLVKKCGELNIDVESVPKRKRRLMSDFFNTVLDVKWRWHILIFIMTFLISWIVFASAWYLIGNI